MLVYLKEPMGRSIVDGYKVYGRYYSYGSFGHTNLPRKTFLKNKDVLEETPITGAWLTKMTGKFFPSLSFLTSEFYLVDYDIVITMAKSFGIEYIKSRQTTFKERGTLRRLVIKQIDSL